MSVLMQDSHWEENNQKNAAASAQALWKEPSEPKEGPCSLSKHHLLAGQCVHQAESSCTHTHREGMVLGTAFHMLVFHIC